jgi:hypothetical protein
MCNVGMVPIRYRTKSSGMTGSGSALRRQLVRSLRVDDDVSKTIRVRVRRRRRTSWPYDCTRARTNVCRRVFCYYASCARVPTTINHQPSSSASLLLCFFASLLLFIQTTVQPPCRPRHILSHHCHCQAPAAVPTTISDCSASHCSIASTRLSLSFRFATPHSVRVCVCVCVFRPVCLLSAP